MSVSASGLPVRTGAVAGGIAWIVGLVVTYALLQLEVIGGAFGPLIGQTFGLVVFVFASLHLWPMLFGSGTTLSLFWTIVPLVIILGAGYVTADRTGGGVSAGATVAVGYFALTVLSVIYFISAFGQVDAIQMIAYLVVGGALFPAVFGGLGGYVAEEL